MLHPLFFYNPTKWVGIIGLDICYCAVTFLSRVFMEEDNNLTVSVCQNEESPRVADGLGITIWGRCEEYVRFFYFSSFLDKIMRKRSAVDGEAV